MPSLKVGYIWIETIQRITIFPVRWHSVGVQKMTPMGRNMWSLLKQLQWAELWRMLALVFSLLNLVRSVILIL